MATKTKKKTPSRRPGRPSNPPPPQNASRVDSLSALAGIIGVTHEACRKARQDGQLIADQDGYYDVERSRAVMADRAARGNRAFPGDEVDPGSIAELRKRELRAKCDEREMKVKERAGQLVEKSDVIRVQVERELAFKHVIMALPKRLSPLLVGKGRVEIEAILAQHCSDALRHLSTGH